MSLPEISRRCRSCGAAVRAGARFCPQCGNGMSDGDGASADAAPARESSGSASNAAVDAESREAEPPRQVESPSQAESPARGSESQGLGGDGARVVADEQSDARRASPPTGEAAGPFASAAPSRASQQSQQSQPADGAGVEDSPGRVARVREASRARVENTRARVERAKGDALVALEETPDDSGMRFVFVAVFLFALFILFLLLSTTVLR